MLEKIFQKQQSSRQLWGAVIGSFLGLFLLLAALQLYHDIRQLTEVRGDDRYVMINKKVNIFNTLGASSAFTKEEIDTLTQQKFIKNIGKFTPNTFQVSASSSMMGFYTELFFEAIEDEYLDIRPAKFKWQEGQPEIPIILSRDYLALYNFGFAPSQGLPQFTQNTIKKVSVDINLKGRGLRQNFNGRIVGFSDRINSVLVPQSFMNWANSKFGTGVENKISRLILETDNPYSRALQNYLQENNFEVARGKLIGGQVGLVINGILIIIALIGLIITLLSVLVFALNFELMISNASREIGLLMQLGYRPQQISGTLTKKLFRLFGPILMLAFLVVLLGHFGLVKWMDGTAFGIRGGLHWSVYLTALLLGVLFLLLNRQLIRNRVRNLFA